MATFPREPVALDPSPKRTANMLLALEDRAVRLRKLLLSQEKQIAPEHRRAKDDAVKLARTIEQIARHAGQLSAEDASAAVDVVEVMVDDLVRQVRRICASSVGIW